MEMYKNQKQVKIHWFQLKNDHAFLIVIQSGLIGIIWRENFENENVKNRENVL